MTVCGDQTGRRRSRSAAERLDKRKGLRYFRKAGRTAKNPETIEARAKSQSPIEYRTQAAGKAVTKTLK